MTTLTVELDSENTECCGNCGWEGTAEELLDDVYQEGVGHKYCPECMLSI